MSMDVRLLCLGCNRNSFDGLTHPGCRGRYVIDGAFCGVVYGRVIRKLIYTFKYQPYVTDLREFMGEIFYEGLSQQEIFMKILEQYKPVLVPIPLSKAKLRKRGYNQSEILAEELGRRFGLEIVDILLRQKETKPQFGLSREDRRVNMHGAFGVGANVKIPENILLVDDVLTSGSTLFEAANVLKRNGGKRVWGVAFARDQSGD